MSDRDRRAIVVCLVVVAAAAGYRLVLSPMVEQWQAARASVATAEAQVDAVGQRLDRLDSVRRRLSERYGPGVGRPLATVEALRVAFPEAVRAAVEAGGAEARRVEVQGVRKLRDVPGVASLSLRVTAVGGDGAIPEVLRQVAAGPYPAVVESLNLSMDEPNRREKWEMVMVVSTPGLDVGSGAVASIGGAERAGVLPGAGAVPGAGGVR